jgi:hypothetical protein
MPEQIVCCSTHNRADRGSTLLVLRFSDSGWESTSIHLVPAERSVTIMGLVEFNSGLISDAEPETFKTHSFNDY